MSGAQKTHPADNPGRYELLPLKLIDSDPANPASRTQLDKLASLTKSIRELGQLLPILVIERPKSNHYLCRDGHRRIKIARLLERDTIPSVILPQSMDPMLVYSAANQTQRHLSSREWAESWLQGGDLRKGAVLSQILAIERLVSRDYVDKIVRVTGYSPQVYNVARRVARYAYNDDTDDRVRTVLTWLVDNKAQAAATGALTIGVTPGGMREAIEAGRLPGA